MEASNVSPTAAEQKRVRMMRTAPLAVRVWTGRSALSVVTTTTLPHIATAGARRTRVSDVRLSALHPRVRRNLD